jgi:ABC-type phosphonate transport system ATPase subunit
VTVTATPLIALHDITKSYGAVKSLDGVTMHLHRGEVLGTSYDRLSSRGVSLARGLAGAPL